MVIRSPSLFSFLFTFFHFVPYSRLLHFEYVRVGNLCIRAALLPRITVLEFNDPLRGKQ